MAAFSYRLRRTNKYYARSLHPDLELINLDQDCIKFGRNPEQVDIVLHSTGYANMISREHAEIRRSKLQDGTVVFHLYDRSLNGTYVNDYRVAGQSLLRESDIIQFGHINGAAIAAGEQAPQPDAEFTYVFERFLREPSFEAKMVSSLLANQAAAAAAGSRLTTTASAHQAAASSAAAVAAAAQWPYHHALAAGAHPAAAAAYFGFNPYHLPGVPPLLSRDVAARHSPFASPGYAAGQLQPTSSSGMLATSARNDMVSAAGTSTAAQSWFGGVASVAQHNASAVVAGALRTSAAAAYHHQQQQHQQQQQRMTVADAQRMQSAYHNFEERYREPSKIVNSTPSFTSSSVHRQSMESGVYSTDNMSASHSQNFNAQRNVSSQNFPPQHQQRSLYETTPTFATSQASFLSNVAYSPSLNETNCALSSRTSVVVEPVKLESSRVVATTSATGSGGETVQLRSPDTTQARRVSVASPLAASAPTQPQAAATSNAASEQSSLEIIAAVAPASAKTLLREVECDSSVPSPPAPTAERTDRQSNQNLALVEDESQALNQDIRNLATLVESRCLEREKSLSESFGVSPDVALDSGRNSCNKRDKSESPHRGRHRQRNSSGEKPSGLNNKSPKQNRRSRSRLSSSFSPSPPAQQKITTTHKKQQKQQKEEHQKIRRKTNEVARLLTELSDSSFMFEMRKKEAAALKKRSKMAAIEIANKTGASIKGSVKRNSIRESESESDKSDSDNDKSASSSSDDELSSKASPQSKRKASVTSESDYDVLSTKVSLSNQKRKFGTIRKQKRKGAVNSGKKKHVAKKPGRKSRKRSSSSDDGEESDATSSESDADPDLLNSIGKPMKSVKSAKRSGSKADDSDARSQSRPKRSLSNASSTPSSARVKAKSVAKVAKRVVASPPHHPARSIVTKSATLTKTAGKKQQNDPKIKGRLTRAKRAREDPPPDDSSWTFHDPQQACASKAACAMPSDAEVQWVQCDDCLGWFHVDCAGKEYDAVKNEDDPFICADCK